MQKQAARGRTHASPLKQRALVGGLQGWIGGLLVMLLAGNLSAQSPCSQRSGCGHQVACPAACPKQCCTSPGYAQPCILNYYCPMYWTQQLEGGNGYLYYALKWDVGCNSSTPTAMYGTHATPQFCPNCVSAYTPRATGTAADIPPGLQHFEGYPGQLRRKDFNPITARPEDGGFPDAPGWERPTIVDEKFVCFVDGRGVTIYAKVFTVCLKVRAACIAQNLPNCQSMPEYHLAKIGFELMPQNPNDPDFTPVRIDPIARKVARAYTGQDANAQESAVLILGRGF